MRELYITNSLSRKKELFKPLNEGHVGLYVCGPTVYGDAHLGHARPGVTYDVFVKFLKHLGYKVRYVRNITDVGHLEHDADEGEDIVCAAISSATELVVNILEKFSVDISLEVDEETPSVLVIILDGEDNRKKKSTIKNIVEGYKGYITDLAEAYPEFVQISTEV